MCNRWKGAKDPRWKGAKDTRWKAAKYPGLPRLD